MLPNSKLLGVIPARGGSKGLPGKNIRSFAGLPLIAHTILFARMCPEIQRFVVSTDSTEIAEIAKEYSADVPFIRPAELAQDATGIWPVVRHALLSVEKLYDETYDSVLLLDPTSPAREPEDISGAIAKLENCPEADGIIGVSKPDFNPIWNCMVESSGWMKQLVEDGRNYESRQEVPTVYRVNGSLYIWRSEFMHREEFSWRVTDRHLMFEIPEFRAMSFDTLQEFQRAELMVQSGMINFPWLSGSKG